MPNRTFGNVIRELRQEKGWSVYALGQRTGISDQTIHDLEQSDRQPSLDTARRLAAALGVTLDAITGQLGEPKLPTPKPGLPRGRPPKATPATPPAADLEAEAKKPHGRQRPLPPKGRKKK